MLNVVSRPTNDGLVDVYSTQCRFRLVDSLLITPQIARNLSPPRENGKTKMDQSNASTVSPFSQSNQSFFRSNAARACLLTHGVVGWCVGIILEGIHSQFAQFGWIQGGFDIFVEFQAGGIDFLHELSEVIELRTKSRQNPKKFFLHDFYFLRPHSDSINRGLQRASEVLCLSFLPSKKSKISRCAKIKGLRAPCRKLRNRGLQRAPEGAWRHSVVLGL